MPADKNARQGRPYELRKWRQYAQSLGLERETVLLGECLLELGGADETGGTAEQRRLRHEIKEYFKKNEIAAPKSDVRLAEDPDDDTEQDAKNWERM